MFINYRALEKEIQGLYNLFPLLGKKAFETEHSEKLLCAVSG